MISGKSFVVTDGNNISDKSFDLSNGLQQGTVNSQILFNIYTGDLLRVLRLFHLNTTEQKKGMAFADDLVLYYIGDNPLLIQSELQILFNKVQQFYITWKLKINASKCETILFRRVSKYLNQATKRNWKSFAIKDTLNHHELIPHKRIVKYSGVHLDDLLSFSQHINIQIKKSTQ